MADSTTPAPSGGVSRHRIAGRGINHLSGTAVALALFGAFGGLLLCVSLYAQLGEPNSI